MKYSAGARSPLKQVFIIGVLVLISSSIPGCLDMGSDDEDRIIVVVSILPQKEFAERLGGEKVKVTVMVGEGQDPHAYEPRPSQLKDVGNAAIYFKVGSGIGFEEVWMDTLMEQNRDMEIVDGSRGIELISMGNATHDEEENDGGETRGEGEHDHEGMDPHIWNSPKNAVIMVNNLLESLKNVDPANADYYTNNSREYLVDLQAIDMELRTALEPFSEKKFLVYHPAFGYLAHDYDLEMLTIEEEGKEPSAAGVAAIIDQAKAENITTVFVHPQFDQSNAETIATEIDGNVVIIDPLGSEYLENMKEVTRKLVQGFEQGSAVEE